LRIQTETAVGVFILIATAIFLYMSYQVGSFRFDRLRYNTYTVYFSDISGVSKKSDVKIAGVKVGWVDAVDLINEGQQVKATLMIDKKYVLYNNAHAIVRQEGLLGSKYLEIVSGDPLLSILPSGSMLTGPSRGPVPIDELLQQFKNIAGNVEEFTSSFKSALGGQEGEDKLKSLFGNLKDAAERFAAFAQSAEQMMRRNEGNVDMILSDMKTVLQDLKSEIPRLSSNLQQNFERISTVLDRDFNRVANQFENVGAPLGEIAHKISEGRGLLGQLINDEGTAQDLRVAANGIKDYFERINRLGIVFDIHTESMTNSFPQHCFQDNRGYFLFRIHPSEDYFYLAGLTAAQSGLVERSDTFKKWYDVDNECRVNEMVPHHMDLDPNKRLKYAPVKRKVRRLYDRFLLNLQVGKIFGHVAFRGGLIDNTGGIAMDLDIPLTEKTFRWVSSLELFDVTGRQRFIDNNHSDDRPHFKWLNRLFFTRNMYFTFGADDFISRSNKSAFFGVGVRFADDDVKYLASRVSLNT
jgi:phospholipid/cholesterol/gamma-HCH transport system substrate-binding protein